jgi:septum site-determining protein MinD
MDMVQRGDMMSVEDVCEILPIHLLGAIPDDEQIVIATNQGEPVIETDSLSGKAFRNICKRIIGEEVPLLNLNVRTGFLRKLFGR